MITPNAFTLVNQQTGNLALQLLRIEENPFEQVQRLNYYTLIWVQEGSGLVKSDFSEFAFEKNCLFAFSPYQPFMFTTNNPIKGIVLSFHPDFFCIHKHHQEVACSGVLFNNIYEAPFVEIDQLSEGTLDMMVAQIQAEMQQPALAQYELLVSYLKIILITASRLKSQQKTDEKSTITETKEPFILQNLKNYIELHFKTKHTPSDYAALLFVSPKTLAKITKTHFNKTLSDLISERIIIEAKRELYLSSKTVKEIAHELGYEDEYYFSRFFKNNTSVSPQLFRETIGFAKAEL